MVLIIAEAGVNHNGSITLAKELIDAAKSCGADIVKFQLFHADELVVPSAKKANYQIKNNKEDETQFEMLKNLELTFKEQKELKNYCDKKNIEFLSSGFDLESLKLLKELDLKRYKIPSGEITNLPFLKFIGSQKKPIILSTGMSNLEEINMALEQLYKAGTKTKDITILHCTTEYPAPLNDVHLRAMQTIQNNFNVKVGYSDHTLGIEVSIAAVALGATVIEKHLTLDRSLSGPDQNASLEPSEFSNLVNSIRNISIALGTSEKKIRNCEKKNLPLVRKSIVAKKNIKKGEVFSMDNLSIKRPGTGISPMKMNQIIGIRSKRDFRVNDLIILN